jgi:TRAP-type C4-dicarboxylate transport system substrate-binding protein
MDVPLVRLAGYQGQDSILTEALQLLAQQLQDSSWGLPVDCEADVTARQEKAAALFDSVEQGKRHLAYMASGYLSARVSELAVLDLPFSVADRGAALAALDGRAGELLSQAVADKSGFHVLAFWDNGFRHISNAVHPIRHPRDCAGLIIRTLDSANYRAALGALGFDPVTTDVKDLVRAVATGEVHAQENPLTNVLNFGLWKHHPHVSLTQHYFGVLLLVCSRSWYSALSHAQRDTLSQAVAVATRAQRDSAQAQDAIALAQLKQHGLHIVPPEDIDLVAMRLATQEVAQRQRETLSADLLSAYFSESPKPYVLNIPVFL